MTTLTQKVLNYTARKNQVTSNEISRRFSLDIRHASAILCVASNNYIVRKRKRIHQPGKRWYWLFEYRGVSKRR